jgi:hypothetical protein
LIFIKKYDKIYIENERKVISMTDKYIMEQMEKHYKCALELFPEDRIVGIFIQGSKNYYLEDEESDIDTKLLVVPSVEDIVLNKKAESTTYYIKDGKLVYDISRDKRFSALKDKNHPDHNLQMALYREMCKQFTIENAKNHDGTVFTMPKPG